jgi:hypothetical protein
MSETPYLNAIVERGRSFRVLTEEYSPDAVKELMSHAPEAIALAPPGTVDVTRLLVKLKAFSRGASVRDRPAAAHRWKCYWRDLRDESLHYCGVLDDTRDIPEKLAELSRRSTPSALLLIIVDSMLDRTYPSRSHEELILDLFVTDMPALVGAWDDAVVRCRQESRQQAPSERLLLREARQELLEKVVSFTSEELATAGGSMSGNASQYALDLRSRGKVFGVRFGRTWHYPKFQFDTQRRALPEMEAVLDALTPDPQGWDRLQWFVTPHERLRGRSPLQMWDSDRNKVIEAAQTEHWHGRRD